jgi:hypothetical protein
MLSQRKEDDVAFNSFAVFFVLLFACLCVFQIAMVARRESGLRARRLLIEALNVDDPLLFPLPWNVTEFWRQAYEPGVKRREFCLRQKAEGDALRAQNEPTVDSVLQLKESTLKLEQFQKAMRLYGFNIVDN